MKAFKVIIISSVNSREAQLDTVLHVFPTRTHKLIELERNIIVKLFISQLKNSHKTLKHFLAHLADRSYSQFRSFAVNNLTGIDISSFYNKYDIGHSRISYSK